MTDLKACFLLDPEIIFLNHGSFGACPQPVFETYQAWQRRLERQPVLFLGRELPELERQARRRLAAELNAEPDDLVYIPNATYGVNIVARSLALSPGDEIVTTDHEYGACNYTWEFICRKTGARYLRTLIPLPLPDDDEIVERLWQNVTARTRLIYLSHITSPTAARFPVEAICARARREGILTLIDGAHAPGQMDLDLEAIGADFYTGNCHKWMLSPKGAAFLHTRRERQTLIEPLVVSWGAQATPETTHGSRYLDYLEWTGTKDPAAALSVPVALDFMTAHDWPAVRRNCHRLAAELQARLAAQTGCPPLYGDDRFEQMFAVELPGETDLDLLKTRLYDEFRIEVPLVPWNEHKLLRVSIQVYNDASDADALVDALIELL
jgi:isopenicillin-N epimerase